MGKTIRFKLILFTFGSILVALVVAGVAIDFLLANLYGEQAKHNARHGYELVYDEIKSLEKDITERNLMISIAPAVVSPVNLVNHYQDIENYQSLVFDMEKKNLASFLFDQINIFHSGMAAVYSKTGELIAFALHDDLNSITGITTYDKDGAVYLSKAINSDTWKSRTLSSLIDSRLELQDEWDSFTSRVGKIEYISSENHLAVESLRTIQREYPDGSSESIGFVKILTALDKHFVEKLSDKTHTNISLVLTNGKILNKPDKLGSLNDLNYSSSLFGSIGFAKETWLDHEIYYMHSYVLPVIDGKVYLLASQQKSDLNYALNRSRFILFLIFLFTASIIIPFGIYWLNTRVSRPLNKLTQQLEEIEKYEYPEFYESSSKDEISLLGNGLNKMVDVIKSREQELKSSQKNLNEAQHLAKIGSWKLDIVNNKLDWSDETFRIFEKDPKTFNPSYEGFMDAISPDDRERVSNAYIDSLRKRQPYDITHCLQLKDGSIKYVHEHCESVFDEEGSPLVSKGTVQDITEKKYKDEILSRAEKMDALGKLTGGIAHDFNNMLGVILGYSELLQNALTDNGNKLKYINEILAAGERARVLTKKLLAFSRKEATTTEIIDINKLLLEERDLLEKTLTARIDLVYDFEEGLWPVLVDKSDIQNAVLNMSINAMHAIPDTGRLTIQTGNVHLDVADIRSMDLDAGDYVLLSITDTGVGMDETTRSKLFDPFFSTKGEKGTGLGMSQVYAFIQQAGGSIYVYSEPGHGTKIAMYLPRSNEHGSKSPQKEHDTAEQEKTGHETILVVDDEMALRELAVEILSSQNYRVLCAESGIEALKILETESVDLMLSDVIMPKMDGYQLAAKVHEMHPDVKIQIASGFTDDRHLNTTNENLHQQRLQKPYTSKILLRRIRQLLDENKESADKSSLAKGFIDKSAVSIQWSNKFNSGLSVLDADHKMLVNMVNRCEKIIKDDQQDEGILSILQDLITYVGHHFKREELLMEICEYPDIDNHKKLHVNLTMQIERYVKEYGNGRLTAKSLLDFLTNWLNTHIVGEDLAIAPYCKGKNIKIEQAFKNAGYDYQANDIID